MQKFTIDKSFDFCYGHRVHTQMLNLEFTESGHSKAKCRHIHGHQGKVHVFLESETLNPQGMVEDFVHLGWLKNFIDTWLDHKFIIDINDPRFSSLVVSTFDELCLEMDEWPFKDPTYETVADFISNHTKGVFVPETDMLACCEIDLAFAEQLKCTPVYEQLEGYTLVNFVPTSENLSRWMFDIAKAKMQRLGIKVSRVDWFETPKSRSSYSE